MIILGIDLYLKPLRHVSVNTTTLMHATIKHCMQPIIFETYAKVILPKGMENDGPVSGRARRSELQNNPKPGRCR